METTRLETFSDGVLAIAVTLLILDIRVPPAGGQSLGDALLHQWPNYAAYVVSFLTIGIIWINHHAMVRRLARADHGFLALNLVLLMCVAALPFTTGLMAEYLRHPAGEHLAAAVYGGSFLAMSLAFYALQRHILYRRPGLLRAHIDAEAIRTIDRRNKLGLLPYALATALAAVSAYITLAICAAIAAYYALPGTTADAQRE